MDLSNGKGFYDNLYMNMNEDSLQWREMGGAIKARNIARIIEEIPVKTIIDIGCGTGSVLHYLSQSRIGSAYYALDIAEPAINWIKARKDIPELVEASTYDGINIPYQDKQFNLAILSHVIEHILDPGPLIKEAARVAHYLAIEVPLEENLYTHVKVSLFHSRYREDIGHVQWFNLQNFRALLELSCGLKVVKMQVAYLPDEIYYFRKGRIKGVTFAQLWLRKTLRRISTRLYTSLLTDHCIALARSIT